MDYYSSDTIKTCGVSLSTTKYSPQDFQSLIDYLDRVGFAKTRDFEDTGDRYMEFEAFYVPISMIEMKNDLKQQINGLKFEISNNEEDPYEEFGTEGYHIEIYN